jgi:AmmeMemoRadiSam system protein A
MPDDDLGRALLATARHAIAVRFSLPAVAAVVTAAMQRPGATFVTLMCGDELRGCIGAIVPRVSLAEQTAESAYAAAFQDHRFARLTRRELSGLKVSVHVLSPLAPMAVTDLESLYAQLRPGDGLVLRASGRQAVFLPVMWEQLPTAQEFVGQLLRKAGLRAGEPIFGLGAEKFVVEIVE